MEEAEEKMAALKRAYADVMLNMAKESAARIMASEQRAARFRQDLRQAKEEAVNTLVRVKGILDTKVKDAERAASVQARRVRELEARLSEAENTITLLRAELTRAEAGGATAAWDMGAASEQNAGGVGREEAALVRQKLGVGGATASHLDDQGREEDPRTCGSPEAGDEEQVSLGGRNGGSAALLRCRSMRKVDGDPGDDSAGVEACSDMHPDGSDKDDDDDDDDDDGKGGGGGPLPLQGGGERLVKYTLRRKRKRGSPTGTEQETRPPDRNRGVSPEPHKAAVAAASNSRGFSRDSRRIVQVARQLISLSEKKW